MNDLDKLEQEIIKERKEFSTKQQLLINEYVENNSVNVIVAWAMWFFLGQFGGHRFLFKKKKAILMLVLELIGMITSMFLIGLFIMAAIVVWWIIDAFSIPSWLKQSRLDATIQAISIVKSKSVKDFNKTKDSSITDITDIKNSRDSKDNQNQSKKNDFASVDDTDGDFTDFSKPRE
ncbi:TM2 domain-containing protein [Apilactobacillus kunkeei]|uniref:TM2 domain-containing protein n=1 Tax=Apilactobacillus kunkeei TaxID=148814 RepID=UPI0006CE940A|nr:TM2 domain-containing protein [Apilactobacillus kunkeei]KPN80485.1 TM2 domain-containing protein [Apilactobacillus kunkeei]